MQEAPEQKEAAIEEDKELKEEKKSKLEGKKAIKSKKTEEAKGSKRQKTMQCKVTLLDDALFECELDVRGFPNYTMFLCVCDSVCGCYRGPTLIFLLAFVSISFL